MLKPPISITKVIPTFSTCVVFFISSTPHQFFADTVFNSYRKYYPQSDCTYNHPGGMHFLRLFIFIPKTPPALSYRAHPGPPTYPRRRWHRQDHDHHSQNSIHGRKRKHRSFPDPRAHLLQRSCKEHARKG